MDTNVILQAISSVGFPIVMCLILAFYIKYVTEKNNEVIMQIMDRHKDETNDFKTAIDNNTKAIEVLTAKVDSLVSKV